MENSDATLWILANSISKKVWAAYRFGIRVNESVFAKSLKSLWRRWLTIRMNPSVQRKLIVNNKR